MWNLDNLQLNKYIKWSDHVRFWIDYMRLNFYMWLTLFDKKIEQLNITNSNISHDWIYTYTRTQTPNWMALKVSVSYNDTAIPIMFYSHLQGRVINPLAKKNTIYPQSRLDFYWAFYRLQEIWFLDKNYIEKFLSDNTFEDPTITRIDYAVDLFYLYKKFLPNQQELFLKINQSSKQLNYWKQNNPESWSVWTKSSQKYFVRMYDKLLDSSNKWKFMYYWDYFRYTSVHRFEVQFMNHFCKWFTYSRIDDLIFKVEACLHINKEKYDWNMFYKYSDKYDINDFNKVRHVKALVNKWVKFAKAWLNPYELLYNWISLDWKIDKEVHYNYLEDFLKILPIKRI